MKKSWHVLTVACASLLLYGFPSLANEPINIHVIDQHGAPLEHAVVEVIQSQESKIAPAVLAHVAIMDQVNKQFSPTLLVIEKGQSVLFPNSDNIRHHVYSFSAARPFELKLYAGKQKDPILFPNHGVAVLGCNIHDSMVGYIYIADSADVKMTDAQGNAQLTANPTDSISVWHNLNQEGAEKRQVVALSELTLQDGRYVVTLAIAKAKARDTFEATFK